LAQRITGEDADRLSTALKAEFPGIGDSFSGMRAGADRSHYLFHVFATDNDVAVLAKVIMWMKANVPQLAPAGSIRRQAIGEGCAACGAMDHQKSACPGAKRGAPLSVVLDNLRTVMSGAAATPKPITPAEIAAVGKKRMEAVERRKLVEMVEKRRWCRNFVIHNGCHFGRNCRWEHPAKRGCAKCRCWRSWFLASVKSR
jgi:hypothetical protein